MSLPQPCLNGSISTPERPVWKIAGVPCAPDEYFLLTFEQADAEWRHGLWLGVEGMLEVNGARAPQFTLWVDTSPDQVEIRVVASDDRILRFYNIWDSGRGLGTESQSATSGMVREELGNGDRYRCNAIGHERKFDALVFRLSAMRG